MRGSIPILTAQSIVVTCRTGPLKGRRLEISSDTTIGREAYCQVVLDDPKVSRHHGTFQVRDGDLFYIDNKSTNGSYLNGQRITEARVELGDVLKVGATEFALSDEGDFRTINIVQGDSMVTGIVNTNSVKPDALAVKFQQIFEYYKDHEVQMSEHEKYELVRTQRLLNGLKNILSISTTLSKIVRMSDLMEQIGKNLFEVFAGAENLVILLAGEDKKKIVPRYARHRNSSVEPSLRISQTVLDRAVKERSTLIANDAAGDARLANSESIIGFAVKSVMCAPLVSGDQVLGALYLDNRQENVTYDDLDAELVTVFANQCAIAIDNANLCDSLQESYHQTLQSLVNAIEAKDAYTMGHTARVSKYSVGIGRAYGFDEKRIDRLRVAAELHDIGKIGVQEGIINKAGKLTDTEYSSIKQHVEMGEHILKPITYLKDVLPYIRGHHERWDGSGYPDGLKGEQCPLEGRILAVADTFDAMTSQRPYNKPLTFPQALAKIKEGTGKIFDPSVVSAFEKYVVNVLLKEGLEEDSSPSTFRASGTPQQRALADPKTHP